MALELKPRITCGGSEWPSPVSECSLQWLREQFLSAQRARRDTVTSACAVANKQIDDARRKAAEGLPVIGEKRKDGSVLQSPYHLQLQQVSRSIADQQVADVIRNVKLEADAKIVPILKDMHKASLVVVDLQARVFDKLSCLARVSADYKRLDLMAFRTHCAVLVTGAEPIVLHRLAQAAIDRGGPEDFIVLHAVLCENIKLPRDRRAFSNAALLDMLEPPEYLAAQPLLAKVVDLEKEAGIAYANLGGHVGQVSLARISRGLAAVKLAKDGLPAAGDDDAV